MFGNGFGNMFGSRPGNMGTRSVIGSDGRMHLEQQVGNMRYDLTNGNMSTVIGNPGEVNAVFGANGTGHVEQQVGNMRIHLDGSGFDTIL